MPPKDPPRPADHAAPVPTDPLANRLLAALPEEDYRHLLSHLKHFSFDLRDVILYDDTPIRCVYFPLNGVASYINRVKEGATLEVGMIGREGVLGHAALSGQRRLLQRIMAQTPVQAMGMDADFFREESRRNDTFLNLILRYSQALFDQVTQTSACNSFHRVEQRLSRWLLMSHDRVESDRFPMTHKFMAAMLGVRRSTVTEVAGMLQEVGYIRYHLGTITVLDRKGLEECSCDCYGIMREAHEAIFR